MPVLTGLKTGIGLVILLDQAPKLLGLHIPKQSFFAGLASLIRHLPNICLPTLAVGGTTLVILIAVERLKPHSPAPLVMAAAAIAASWALNLGARGVATVGPILRGLPSLTVPDPGLVFALLPGAIGIALMSFTESIAAARAFAAPGDPPSMPTVNWSRPDRQTWAEPCSAPCRPAAERRRRAELCRPRPETFDASTCGRGVVGGDGLARYLGETGTLPFFDCFRWLPVDESARDLPALASVFDYDVSSNGFPVELKHARGIEPHGRSGDPGFTAPGRGDFRLIQGALAATSGCTVMETSDHNLVCEEKTGNLAFVGALGPDGRLYEGPASARFQLPE